MRALSTVTTLTAVQAVQRAWKCAEKNKTGTNWCGTMPQPEPREFRTDHLLLHSWDFHDVLCRLHSRVINNLHCILEFLRNIDHRP